MGDVYKRQTQEYAYDAYGYINADEFGIQAPFYGYNGEEQNPFTGLQYLRARYYACLLYTSRCV